MELRHPDREHHLGAISDFFSLAFSDYWDRTALCQDGYIEGAPYDWQASRVGLIDGELATHFGVWDLSMRIGSTATRVAGIGAVATGRAHRRLGLMEQTARASVDSLKDAGYAMSLLFGIQKYYLRFGYVGTFVERIFGLSTRDLTPLAPATAFGVFDGDLTQFSDQYNEENATVTGTFVRPTYTTNRRPNKWHAYAFDGGYVVAGLEGEVLTVADCAGPPQQIVDVVRQLAERELSRKIELVFLPPRSLMGEYLQTVGHSTRTRFVPDGGPLIKVVNLCLLMADISAELSRRLRESPLADYTGNLLVSGDEETVNLSIAQGLVTGVEPRPASGASRSGSAIIAGAALGRLVIGDDDPGRICRQAGITVTGDANQLLPVLFPNQEPSTILWDRF